MSISIAGLEYLPLTFCFGYAEKNGVALSLMTAYMEAADNSFRMLQQLALGFPLGYTYTPLKPIVLIINMLIYTLLTYTII